MPVKINGLLSGALKGNNDKDTVTRTTDSSNAYRTNSVVSAQSDSVNLTSTSTQLQQLEHRIWNMPVVDARLVEEVQRQLTMGSFIVDSENAASKLITMETSLP